METPFAIATSASAADVSIISAGRGRYESPGPAPATPYALRTMEFGAASREQKSCKSATVGAAGATHEAYEAPTTHLSVAVAGLKSYNRDLDAAIVRAGAAGQAWGAPKTCRCFAIVQAAGGELSKES